MKKKKTIAWITLFLAAVLLLSACGSKTEAPAAATPLPEEEIEPKIELPESVIGTWISINNPEDNLVFTEDGKLTVNGTEIELLELSENGILYRCGDTEGTISYAHEYLSCGFPLPLSEKSSYAFFYRQGEENPATRFAGTWTLCSGEGSVWNDAVVEEFSITDDGEVLLGGESFPAVFQMVFDHQENGGWMLRADGDRIWCSFYNDDPEALNLGTGVGWGKYCQNVKTAELSLDNWQDFFDTLVVYSLGRDDAGNIHNSMARLLLAGKDDLEILCVRDGSATVTSSPKSFAMIQYDLDAGTYDFRAVAPKERWKYNTNYFLPYKNTTTNDVFRLYEDETLLKADQNGFKGWAMCALVYSDKTLMRDGNMLTSPTITDFYVIVSKISGTICYRETD